MQGEREEAGWTAERSESLASSEKRFQTRPPPATRFLSHLKGGCGVREAASTADPLQQQQQQPLSLHADRKQRVNRTPRRRYGGAWAAGGEGWMCGWEGESGGGVGRSVYTVPFISLSSSLIPSCFASHSVIRPPDSLPRFDRCC